MARTVDGPLDGPAAGPTAVRDVHEAIFGRPHMPLRAWMVAGTMRVNRRSVLASWMNAKRPGGSVSCIAWRAIWLFSLRRIASSAGAHAFVSRPRSDQPMRKKAEAST